jgi:hypothetical protein
MFCFNLVQSWASGEQHWPSFNETKYQDLKDLSFFNHLI